MIAYHYQRYYDEHERLKAEHEVENKKESGGGAVDSGADKFSALKSLIATAPTSSDLTTPVVTVENSGAVAMETQPAADVPAVSQVTSNAVSKPVDLDAIDKARARYVQF